MNDRWAAISVPLLPEAVDDVSLALERVVGLNLAVERRPGPDAGGWAVMAHAYVAPGGAQHATRRTVLRALEMLRLAGDGAVGVASEEFVDAEGCRTSWRKFYAPLAVGRRLVIVPAWLEQPAEQSDRIPVFLDSATAFGTGHHPTTRLALEALEAALVPGDIAVDVGTGSGVLAIAAAKLGAARVYALDRDPQAAPAAAANIRRNGVADRIALTVPSTRVAAPEPAALVVANIVASVHVKLMESYALLLATSGRLLLSGVLDDRVDEVVAVAERFGLGLDDTTSANEWRLLEFTLEAPTCR